MLRDVVLAVALYKLAWSTDLMATTLALPLGATHSLTLMIKWVLWAMYFNVQGILLTSWWCLAHEASHGTLSPFSWINDTIGFFLHTVRVFIVCRHHSYLVGLVPAGTIFLLEIDPPRAPQVNCFGWAGGELRSPHTLSLCSAIRWYCECYNLSRRIWGDPNIHHDSHNSHAGFWLSILFTVQP